MGEIPEYIDGLPNICGSEQRIEEVIQARGTDRVFLPPTGTGFAGVDSAFAIALHMHQPLIPAGGPDLRTAPIISNLQWMIDNPGIGDNHNAPVFLSCYKRMGEFVPQLLGEGLAPRVMLEYSGTLLHGLRQMGAHDVLDTLAGITADARNRQAVEWLGCPWGHAVAPSTPVQDYRLHVRAWQHHFAALFGLDALGRVRGFSPAEMALPNHPDVAYEFVKTLIDCGYQWVLVQEHTVEEPDGVGSSGRTCLIAWSAPAPEATSPASPSWSRPRAATPSWSARCSRTTRRRACPARTLAAAAFRPLSHRSLTGKTAG